MSRAALGACRMPIAILDAAQTSRPVTYANPAFEEFFGYAAGEPLGRTLAELIFRGDEALVHRLLAESASRWQARGWTKDGSSRFLELSLGAVRNPEGRTTHWVAAFSDRSELERLRAEIAALTSVRSAA